ncbi:hypothetical protein ACWDG1_02695 [Streptomyces sp. NPDC001177]
MVRGYGGGAVRRRIGCPRARLPIATAATDISRLDEHGAVRGAPPTSMTFEVPRLFRPEALVEIEIVAAVPGGR